jgi:hypothetical protein
MAIAQCPECEGDCDVIVDGEQTPCPRCLTKGVVEVGVFEPICARHCTLCEGSDHLCYYFGYEDTDGEPLMSCKHCTALRHMTQDDDANADY